MTTNVPRGAGRKAHAERTSRHAQRTPLPPKPGKVAAAKAAIAEAQEIEKALNTKSGAKAEAFIAEALRLGWTAKANVRSGEHMTVTVARGDERITIEWDGGVFVDSCVYECAGRSPLKLRNASAAKKQMAIDPEKAVEAAVKVTANKVTRAPRSARSVHPRPRKLPFDGTTLDEDLLQILEGKQITWTNRISGIEETDRVPRQAESMVNVDGTPGRRKTRNHPKITEGPDGRVLTFVGQTGFRSVRVDSIVRVR